MMGLIEQEKNIAEYEKKCRDEFKLSIKELVYTLEPEYMVELAFQFENDLQHSINKLKSEMVVT